MKESKQTKDSKDPKPLSYYFEMIEKKLKDVQIKLM